MILVTLNPKPRLRQRVRPTVTEVDQRDAEDVPWNAQMSRAWPRAGASADVLSQ